MVITITPLAALAPQIEAAAASCKMFIVSISVGLISSSLPDIGNPSTTSKGLLPAFKVLRPLICKTSSSPPSVFTFESRTPGDAALNFSVTVLL